MTQHQEVTSVPTSHNAEFPGQNTSAVSTPPSSAHVTASISSVTTTSFSSFELRPDHLLTLLLAPDLEDSLTPAALLAANNVAIFRLLPLILAAVHRMGESPTRRQCFVKLVSVLRMRVAACRGLKLRFLLLIRNPAFANHWLVKLVHRRDCYSAAKHALEDFAMELPAKCSSPALSLAISDDFISFRRSDSKQVAGWLNDKRTLISFAARRLLHPERGIHIRTINWYMRPIRAAFFATELVDGIMEHANFRSRSEAVQLAQRILDYGLIIKVGGHSNKFSDSKRRVYQCRLALQREDAGYCRVKTSCNKLVTSWSELEKQPTAIKQIEIQLPMDMVDLQSYEFWTSSVYVRDVDKGYRYGYRAITHPLYCGGLVPQAHLDFSKILPEDASSLEESSSVSMGSSMDYVSDLLSPKSAITTTEINDFHQDSSVVGSAIVRKVFSSIARPMIVQLRAPMENADLDEDDHHIVLPPGVLVKEGDNLMQDLGVEVMFQIFNHIWETSPLLKHKYKKAPYSYCYEVFPTSPTQGFMEAMTGLIPLKDYDWAEWRDNYGSDPERVEDILRSTVGSYIGAYICG